MLLKNRFLKNLINVIFASAMCFNTSALACTLFAAQGTAVADGGLLILKTRDAEPSPQSIQKVKTSKYSYYGLFGEVCCAFTS